MSDHPEALDFSRKQRIERLSGDDLYALLDFADRVQKWSLGRWRRKREYGTFGQAAARFKVDIGRIADAVEAHYWMFTPDVDLPLAQRRIDHEGE